MRESPGQPAAAVDAGLATGVPGPTSGLAALTCAPSLDATQAPRRLPLKRPVSVWLGVQPPETTTSWHDPVTHRVLTLDGFGTRAGAFGLGGFNTRFEVSVTTREFDDARAHVSVILHTKSAICWGSQGDDSEANYVEAFG